MLNQFSAEGYSLCTIELNDLPVLPVTSADIDSLIERYESGLGATENNIDEILGGFFPAFSQVRVMKDRSIWLQKVNPQ